MLTSTCQVLIKCFRRFSKVWWPLQGTSCYRSSDFVAIWIMFSYYTGACIAKQIDAVARTRRLATASWRSSSIGLCVITVDSAVELSPGWRHQMETFPFVRGIHRWPVNFPNKASDAELWCFLGTAPGPTVEQTIETRVIWDAIALIMTSL